MESIQSADDDKKPSAPNPEAYVYGSGAAFRPVERLAEPKQPERPRIIAPLSGIGEVIEIPLRPPAHAEASQEQQRQHESALDDEDTDSEDENTTRTRAVASRILDPAVVRGESAEVTDQRQANTETEVPESTEPTTEAMPPVEPHIPIAQRQSVPESWPQAEHMFQEANQPLPPVVTEQAPPSQERVWVYPDAPEAVTVERPVSDPSVPLQPIGSGAGIRPLAPLEYAPTLHGSEAAQDILPPIAPPESLPPIQTMQSWENTAVPPANTVAEQPPTHPDYTYAASAPHTYHADRFGGGSAEYTVPAHASAPAEHYPQVAPNNNLAPLVGLGLVGEFFARRRLRKEVRSNQKENKAAFTNLQKEANANQRQYTEQQQQFAREQRYQTDEMQRMRQIQERFNAPVLTHQEQSPVPQQSFETPQSRSVEHQSLPPITNAEKMPVSTAEQHIAAITDRTELKPGEHKVMDAWRTAIVKNGREVEGAITYGQGYHQERRAEIIPDTTADTPATAASTQGNGTSSHRPAQPQHNNGGGGALVGGFGGYSMPTYSSDTSMAPVTTSTPSLPSGMTTPSLPQGQPTHADPQHQLPASTPEPPSNISNPWFWLMLGLIVAAFFTATLI